MKKPSFTLFELILVITIIAILSALAFSKHQVDTLSLATNQLLHDIKLTRYLALSDNVYNTKEPTLWHRGRWVIKFMNCKSSVGGIYYVIYKDQNYGGMPNKSECAIDPVTKKYYYSNNDCSASADEMKTILLTKEYGIEKIEISCNKTTSIGQIAFGVFGEPYTKLSDNAYDNRLTSDCYLNIFDKNMNFRTITIAKETGFTTINQ